MHGAALLMRFEQTGNSADQDAAIDASRQAVAATPAGHPDRAAMLSALSVALQARFERTGNRADLDAAIDASRQAVAAAIPANAREYQANLGLVLRMRFEQTGDSADLDAAIETGQQAVAATPAGHPHRAAMLSALGTGLRTRFERTGDPADLDAAIDAGQQAAGMEVASPRVRAIAARRWGNAAASGRRWQQAVAGFAEAAELLGLVAPRSLARGDQEHLLEQFGGLAAEAAACCVHAGLTDRAVELFEQGRGVLLGQALDARTGLTALAGQRPDLAARFTVLRDDLDRDDDPAGSAPVTPAGMGSATTDGRAQAARRDMERQRAAAAFDQVIAEIRQVPDFRGFLRPPPAAELLAAADEPVVVVIVSRFGSHALILTGGGVLDPVPLTGLTPQTVYDRVTAFLGALEDAGSPAAEQRLDDTLGWLWDTLAGPVLDRLGIDGRPPAGQPWPRLWWCVSGLLSFLPVHAAGHHHTRDDAAPATVVDRAISSYTPTIRALTYARRSRSATAGDAGGRPDAGDRVIVVAMPHTPGAADLPGAQAEVTGLQRRFPRRVTVLTGAQATHDTVLRALQAGRWAHFACHGASDLSNPSASYLQLTDHRQRPLTVVDVARLRLDDVGLAFLSACSTGRPGGRLADEAIHLASAFQLAGYRHVIATLWPIGDQHAVDIADQIYTTLTTKGEDDVAGAVHAAVRLMRRRWGWDAPSVWASHIHAGA
jgi:tetratricopeptide (TPR) repeat protein